MIPSKKFFQMLNLLSALMYLSFAAGCASSQRQPQEPTATSAEKSFRFYATTTNDPTMLRVNFENTSGKTVAFFSATIQYEFWLQGAFGMVRKVRVDRNDPRADYPTLELSELVILKDSTTYSCLLRLPDGEKVSAEPGTRIGLVLLHEGVFDNKLLEMLKDRRIQKIGTDIPSQDALQ